MGIGRGIATALLIAVASAGAEQSRGLLDKERLLEKVREAPAPQGPRRPCKKQAHDLADRGARLASEGKANEAIEALTASLEQCPRNSEALARRGAVHLQQKRIEAAIADLEKARETDPAAEKAVTLALGAAYRQRGLASLEKGRYEKAIEDLRKATTYDPNDAATYAQIARAYARQNQFNECVAFSSRAIALNSKLQEAWTNRGACRSGLGDLKKALTDIEMALELEPSGEAYMQRAALLAAKDDCPKATADADEAVKLNPALKKVRDEFLGPCVKVAPKLPVIRD